MRICSAGTAFPPYRYSQTVIAEALRERWQHKMKYPNASRLLTRLHTNCGVEYRNLVFPLEHYPALDSFGKSNDAWIAAAVDLGQKAVCSALNQAGVSPEDVSAIFFVSVTGICSPSIDARLANRLAFPVNIKRIPIFGLGCVAGAAAVARAADYVRAFPRQIALVLSVELCSLTWQDDDQSIANLVSTGLFADGAAAAVIAGAETGVSQRSRGPRILDTRSFFYRNTERVMGWDVVDTGFKIVLSPEVPRVVEENLPGNVDEFLADHNLKRADISSYIFHSGGPRVLEAMQRSLGLPEDALALSWKSLRERGNLSSASVLAVLEDVLVNHPGEPGSYSILAAMGPAFCCELVLLRW